METRMHCQICGRAIKANTGLIAHHGYTRPGDGYQTRSCEGARRLPYEVSCDAIADAITNRQGWLLREETRLTEMLTNPPAELDTNTRRDAWGLRRGPTRMAPRPAGFEPLAARHSYNPSREAYEMAYDNIRNGIRRGIKATGEDITYLTKRLADWPNRETRT